MPTSLQPLVMFQWMLRPPMRWKLLRKLPLIGSQLLKTCLLRLSLLPSSSLFLMIGFKEVTVLSWNIWGASNSKAKRHLMDLIRKHSPTFLIIMETHIGFHTTKSFWDRAGYVSTSYVDARGHSGGIWILQQHGSNIVTTVHDVFMDTITIKLSLGSASWFLSGIYASTVYSKRLDLWRHLIDLRNSIDGPWLLLGDFNDIIHPSEQRGGNFYHSRAAALLNVIDRCSLVDLDMTGGQFTWHRPCTGNRNVFRKLDRVLADVTWRMNFPDAYVELLCKFHSDHNPILLRCGAHTPAHGPRPFRFEAAWITHPDYLNVVTTAWMRVPNSPMSSLLNVQQDSLLFNKETFGRISKRKYDIEKRLKGIQRSLERIDSARLVYLEQELRQEYDKILAQEEIHWYQKARDDRIKLGDRNTKFFHTKTVIRRKRNKIHGLHLPSGNWCTDDTLLREEALTFFKNLFCAPPQVCPALLDDLVAPPFLTEEAQLSLTKPVTKDEVTYALNQMHPFKAPGPDGFQGIFFKQYWHIVGDDIVNLISDAFVSGTFDPSLCETLIALIPKVDCPQNFKEFRPISLCNTLYKLITKIMVNRLRPFLDQIVGPFQSSFLPGRGTSDNAIVLQEAIHSMRKSKKKKGDMIFKIDLEKAYDHISWDFLELCLQRNGFPPITVKLIMFCVTSSSLSIIWNGRRLPNFTPTRGLRQGDPLSPYLFVICMEVLSQLIIKAVDDASWQPVRLSRTGPPLSHLFFADDVLLFAKASVNQATTIADIFTRFATLSGLKVNVAKSKVFFSSSTRRSKMNQIVSTTGIRRTLTLGKYLGFPMIHGRLQRKDFEFLEEKISHRLDSWQQKLLNKAARVTLVKSVLNSIPTYYMQLAWLPTTTCDFIDKMARNFIWKGNTTTGVHLVGWNKITQPKQLGGLGIRKAREANTSMLGKLVWDLHRNSNSLWTQVLHHKYAYDDSFLDIKKKPGSVTWNAIMKARDALRDGFGFRLGDGNSSFWFTAWSEVGKLAEHVLYVDIHDLELKVNDVYSDGNWNLDQLYTSIPIDIRNRLRGLPMCLNSRVHDNYTWKGNLDGIYTAKDGYYWLNRNYFVRDSSDMISWSWLWHLQAPEKLKFFLWMVLHASLPTRSLLCKRGMLQSDTCPRCNLATETILHCVRDCGFAQAFWRSIGFSESQFFQETNIYIWLRSGLDGDRSFLFLAACWWLWIARNKLCLANEMEPSHNLRRLTVHYANLMCNCFPHVIISSSTRQTTWNAAKGSGIILNVDGSSIGNPGVSGFGGLLRNSNGGWIIGFAGNIGYSNILHAELLALYHGLQMAWSFGYREISCYSDSQSAIKLINEPVNDWHYYATIIYNIQEILSRDWQVQVIHTLREGNACADFLAKVGAGCSEAFHRMEVPPAGIQTLLLADASGTVFSR